MIDMNRYDMIQEDDHGEDIANDIDDKNLKFRGFFLLWGGLELVLQWRCGSDHV